MTVETLAVHVLALVKRALAEGDSGDQAATMALQGAFHGLLINLRDAVGVRVDMDNLQRGAPMDEDAYRRALETVIAEWTASD